MLHRVLKKGKKKLSTVMERSSKETLKLRNTVKGTDGKISLFSTINAKFRQHAPNPPRPAFYDNIQPCPLTSLGF
jgi:hypothetical protein